MILVSKRRFVFFFMLFVVLGLAFSQPRPTQDFYVNDFANVISAQDRTYLLEKANAFYREQGSQVVVVTVVNMDGYEIEEYANNLFNSWGIGSSANDSGILLIYAHEEGRIRIEVGYGLEGALTDGTAGYILDTFILPHFFEDNYSQGIVDGFNKILETITGEFAVPASQNSNQNNNPPVIFFIAMGMFLVFWCFCAFKASKRGRLGGGVHRLGGSSLGSRSIGSRGGGGRSGGGGSSRSSRR